VATSGYLAAVYLAGDATRAGEAEAARRVPARALVMAVVTGALAIAALIVLRGDARALFDDLTGGAGIVAVVVSRSREPGRWRSCARSAMSPRASARRWRRRHRRRLGHRQSPDILPGLTVHAAAASHATLVALLISIAVGLVVLVPSLVLLFGLVLRGRFDHGAPVVPAQGPPSRAVGQRSVAAVAVALFAGGATLTFLGEGVLLAIGVIALAAFIAVGAAELLRPDVLE